MARAGRAALLADARAYLRQTLNVRYASLIVGDSPVGSGASGEERAAQMLALDDLVLAAVAEDLIERGVGRALTEDGEAVLGPMLPVAAAFARAGIEVGGPIDPRATPQARAQAAFGILAAIVVAPIVFLFASERGGAPLGIAFAVAVAAVCVTWGLWPQRRRGHGAGSPPRG